MYFDTLLKTSRVDFTTQSSPRYLPRIGNFVPPPPQRKNSFWKREEGDGGYGRHYHGCTNRRGDEWYSGDADRDAGTPMWLPLFPSHFQPTRTPNCWQPRPGNSDFMSSDIERVTPFRSYKEKWSKYFLLTIDHSKRQDPICEKVILWSQCCVNTPSERKVLRT
jgi:hypothetical protein